MWKNYLTIAYRTLKRRPGYAAINGVGLAVGMACCLLIVLYVQEELSYDDFHEKAERIVAIGSTFQFKDHSQRGLTTPYPLAAALEAEVPLVTEAVRMQPTDRLRLSLNDQTYYEVDEGYFTEPAFFDVFSFELLRGGPEQTLAAPSSIVLTRPVARRVFAGEDPIGQTLYARVRDTTLTLEVTGIAADPPSNTNLPFDALVSLRTLPVDHRDPSEWGSMMYRTFALLEQGEDRSMLPEHLSAIAEERINENTWPGATHELFAVPLTALHFSKLTTTSGFTGTRRYVYLFSAVALIILLIACINYTNLATARAAKRAKEVGVRKTAGATRFQLARQFLGESVLLTLGALILAVTLTEAAIPAFNEVFGTHLNLAYGENIAFLLALIGLILFVGLVAGSYPALYLSAFEPTKVLKGRTRQGRSEAWMRRGLVVVQFTLSTALLIGTFAIYRQLQFVQAKGLGFNGKQVVTVDLPPGHTWGLFEALRRDVLAQPGVEEATVATITPGQRPYRIITPVGGFAAEAEANPEKTITYIPAIVGHHFIETLDLQLIAGRDFSQKYSSDKHRARILNEAAVRRLGWTPQEAIGKSISGNAGKVIGVVENFHLRSLHEKVKPVVIHLRTPEDELIQGLLIARLAPGHIHEAMDYIEQVLNRYVPGASFDYQFIGEIVDSMYRTERRLGRVFAAVAAVAVLLACLGLFGLAAYAAESRTKEIGIRKVLGASVPSIVALLSKDFLKLVLVAFVIAAPLAYFAMRRWLQDFAYHVEIGPWLFVGAGAAALVIALAAVSYQAIKAALADPVDALRYE